MSQRIAIVGIACRYPDAESPAQLWENVLAGRRAFRRIPPERMRLEDYWSPDPAAPDRFYAQKAAVIEGFEFDRVGHKIAGSTYRSTDLTHWLALDTAARALTDAGYPDGSGLPRESTAVIIGNSLTGEFSRANLMRLRWPYVRRTVAAALRDHGWDGAQLDAFIYELEGRYKSPFPAVDEDTLAGGLSNTIAGRICNHFDLKGGGYTVDGACSSSLLSVATACTALSEGHADAAVAGGVDLSIDPFEIIGFAKTSALATSEMRVYDRRSNGFWPGEGCGMLVLLREEDAEAAGLRSYATIAGWGYSSDGRGGITRPEEGGHRLAIKRAYRSAGFDIASVAYLEGHGTGTAVGDATELRAIGGARTEACETAAPAAISTIKGNIGHTKAAAGAAGLIKAALAVHHQVIPPATGHHDPHPELAGERAPLRVPLTAEPWPAGQPVRAGVSSMGFGGINTHIVLENPGASPPPALDARTIRLSRSRQDCELLLLDADSHAELRDQLAHLAEFSARLAYAELTDLAATLQAGLAGRPVRAAVVAAAPEDAERGFGKLLTLVEGGARQALDIPGGVFLGGAATTPRIGYLFPGQGSGRGTDGGALARRFETVHDLYRTACLPAGGDTVATAVAQPRIVTASAAGLRVLSLLGIEAVAAAGHSLGELTALYWAGAMDEVALLRLATRRGEVMAEASHGGGTMASIAAGPGEIEQLLAGQNVVIAGYNSPRQTVVSGPADAVDRVCRRATESGLTATRLRVSHAFHSDLVAPAAAAFGAHLEQERFHPLSRRVVSTVTSDTLPAGADLAALLVRQVRDPVNFSAATSQIAADVDLLIEVGPGQVLCGLAADTAPAVPAVAMDTDGDSLSGTLRAAAAVYVLGGPVRHDQLFTGRFTRPLPVGKQFRFFASPCESAPAFPAANGHAARLAAAAGGGTSAPASTAAGDGDPQRATDGAGSLDVLRRLAAARAELPIEAVPSDCQPLDHLHLSSITVGQIMNQAARELGVAVPAVTSSLATATLAELAQALDDLAGTGSAADQDAPREPDGVAPWVRAFAVELVRQDEPERTADTAEGEWQVFAPAGHPLAAALTDVLHAAQLGDGVLLCLPPDCDERHAGLMLDAAHAALAREGSARFAVVQDRRGAAGLARTLHLEAPAIATTVITAPLPYEMPAGTRERLARSIVADVAATVTFREIVYDAAGARRVPLLVPADLGPDGSGSDALPLGGADVLLVTGGGKGITAECALALAAESGAAVGLLGRSDPAADAELSANLGRMSAAGVRFRYVRADVTSPDEVKDAVGEIRGSLGPVTAVLHGAGRNEPTALASLDEAAFQRTLAPKISGLETVLTAADPASLRLLITFGSIIGRAGLRGEADYATANDWLTDLTQRVQEDHPRCRCVALEWSVWSGAGMGERLGVLDSLIRDGITPIPPEDGIAMLRQVLTAPQAPTVLVVMGRASGLPTIRLEQRELPLLRFIDQPRVHYPGIELVADAELSAASDPYLDDHLLDGDLLFPAVLGMEAMAQAGAALTGRSGNPVAENMEFLRPIVVPPGGSVTVRVAALRHGPAVQVVIRSSETGFQADHFRATLRYPAIDGSEAAGQRPAGRPGAEVRPGGAADGQGQRLPLDPSADLYGGILFQGGRFQRVQGYVQLAATSCVAEIGADAGTAAGRWFGGFLPGELVLADPGTRDACMHAIQCCVPNATLLPEAVDRLYLAEPVAAGPQLTLHATERLRDGDVYTYDVDVRGSGGLVERWEGLRLHAVRKTDGSGPWVPALLGPYLERQVADLGGHGLRCAVEPDPAGGTRGQKARRAQTATAVSRMLGRQAAVRYRADGKPEVDGGLTVSASHGGGVTLAVAGRGRLACDVEQVRERPADDWEGMLGPEQFTLAQLVVEQRGEDLQAAATRVWGAVECLKKTGRASHGPLTLDEGSEDPWVLLRSGETRIATLRARLRDVVEPVVFTILTEGGSLA